MTERIREVWVYERNGVPDHSYLPSKESLALGAHPPLVRYVPALEADAVSRAEHEAALDMIREARAERDEATQLSLARRDLLQTVDAKLHDAGFQTSGPFIGTEIPERLTAALSKLTALQAELTDVRILHTAEKQLADHERARAEEAERRVQEEYARAVEWMNTADQLRRELAAANARVGRLEEALQKAAPATWRDVLLSALSTAPQASTDSGPQGQKVDNEHDRERDDPSPATKQRQTGDHGLVRSEADSPRDDRRAEGSTEEPRASAGHHQAGGSATLGRRSDDGGVAPQASTEQASPELATDLADGKLTYWVNGERVSREQYDAASTEQASPSPAAGEDEDEERDPLTGQLVSARVGYQPAQPAPSPAVGVCYCDAEPPCPAGRCPNVPAQPAPGGTEHVHDDLMGPRLTCGPCWQKEGGCPVCHVKYGYGHHHSCPGADPTPAEPQGRPEQAGDKVDQLRADIAEALRKFAAEFGENTPVIGDGLGWLADELERGGK